MNQKNVVIIHDPDLKRWLQFREPLQIISTSNISEVIGCLKKIEEHIALGFHAAGFLTYESSPAFDSSFSTHKLNGSPLIWFGIYKELEFLSMENFHTEEDSEISWINSIDLQEYKRLVSIIKDYISKGETYQTNLSFRLHSIFEIEPIDFFKSIYKRHPVPYAAYIETDEQAVCSFSPELFFSLNNNLIICKPMKGTAPRGKNQAEDDEYASKLQLSEKERAENVMIVDMIRNDLGKIAENGSVSVDELFTIEKYATVHQMISKISAKTSASISEIFGALFPCASITGAPKIRTTGIIRKLESSPRGIYCGSIGYMSPGRKALFNVAIRTVNINKHSHVATYSTGSGILYESDALSEYMECLSKVAVVENTPEFSLFESILWVSDSGYFLLTEHLNRMYKSAEFFNFECQVDKLRSHLENLASKLPDGRFKVKILLDRFGKVSDTVTELPKINDKTIRAILSAVPMDPSNRFLYHKTTYRKIYDSALNSCKGFDDVVLWNKDGHITETSIGNIVIKINGEFLTPEINCGLLPGIFRQFLIDSSAIREEAITVEMLKKSDEIFRINSVRKWQKMILSDYPPS